jgi:hypothetical protein
MSAYLDAAAVLLIIVATLLVAWLAGGVPL